LAEFLNQRHFGDQAVNASHDVPAVGLGGILRFFVSFRRPQC
jgi:hypothetical protein